jgi:predicted nuclease with TOPRIM domain
VRKSVQQAQEGVTQAIRKESGVQVRGSRLPLFVEILRKLEEHDRKFEEILAEIRALRENQHKLRENVNKLWEEVRSLRLGYEELRKGQEELREEVHGLQEVYTKLESRVAGLERAVVTLARTVGVTFNDFVASFVEEMLRLSGVPEEKIKVSTSIRIVYGEEVREVDVFNTDPWSSARLPPTSQASKRLGASSQSS